MPSSTRQPRQYSSGPPMRLLSTLAAAALCAGALSTVTASPASAAPVTLRSAAAAKGIYFGGEISQPLLSNSTATSLAAAQFGMITPENEMKWDATEPSPGNFTFAAGDAIVQFGRSNGMRVRGHTMVWANQVPSWVGALPPDQVRAAMERHISGLGNHYRGQVYAWDVVNEPFDDSNNWRDSPFLRAMGPGYIATALHAARAADPGAKLYINDYNIEGVNAKSDAMYNLVKSLKSQGVPLDGVGFEGHLITGQVPADLQANMARFAALGVDVAITELDVRMPVPASEANLAQQATDDANIVRACLAVPRCVGISQWAVGDADSWVPGWFPGEGAATLFDMNYQPKPSYHAVIAALGGGPQPQPGGSTSLGAATWLISSGSHRCLDAPAGGGNGSRMQIWDCWGTANQSFVLAGDGSVRLQGAQAGTCLDAPLGGGAGSAVQIWGCSGNSNQKWALRTDGSLVSEPTGLCAGVAGAATNNGSAIILWQCLPVPDQRWGFNGHQIAGTGSGRCLDEPLGAGNGTQLQIWECHSGQNQVFTLGGDGAVHDRYGRCLDVPAGAGNGARLQVWDCSGGQNQKWVLTASGAITNPASGLSLDVANGSTANGSRVQLWTYGGGSSQKWSMR
ncbi:endo-1,4-beta-xylanase [Longispora albida]|uniref:endo-1,4-beta-xylanase n=1 Tax=Longispora albida TaxID=203523 RepID=UPI0012FAB437|nr:endo-1,4-beta-xylanase [Longispora albida]